MKRPTPLTCLNNGPSLTQRHCVLPPSLLIQTSGPLRGPTENREGTGSHFQRPYYNVGRPVDF